LAHPFVQALGEGTLKADLFRAFIAQDAFFLGAFGTSYALALARCDETESITSLHELLVGVLEELKVHRVYATELGIDLESAVPNLACRAYTDFLLRTAWHTSLGATVAAMTPFMRLYSYLGGELVGSAVPSIPIAGGSKRTVGKSSGYWQGGWRHCSIGLQPTQERYGTAMAMRCSAS
jgi:thiaminase/transcriptional activator TenA